jgi:hypothetical protein|tara:strand:+ start:1958 stop:2161 length:204 start_codon:yes stop_codon:yes gene_type:complete
MSDRYIPRIEVVANAAKELPDPMTWRDQTYKVPLNDERLIEFQRIKFKDRKGRVASKWIYDGKVRVD